MWKKIQEEPVAFSALISAGISLGVGFGLKITPEQFGLLMAFVAALLAFITRQAVTPNGLAELRWSMGNAPTQPLSEKQKEQVKQEVKNQETQEVKRDPKVN